jgi:riboflavin kinase/FMN adenylyltransferase
MCLPADGVYSGIIKRANGSSHVCAINLGRRPTFFEHADHSLLEAHLLDFDGDLYGERVSVTFEHFLRSERKFEGLESIKTQLQLDVAAARVAQLR